VSKKSESWPRERFMGCDGLGTNPRREKVSKSKLGFFLDSSISGRWVDFLERGRRIKT
jgi:hypothetical protein